MTYSVYNFDSITQFQGATCKIDQDSQGFFPEYSMKGCQDILALGLCLSIHKS